MDTGDGSQSYFSAARPGLDVEVAGLELLRRLLFGDQRRNPLQNPRLQPIPNFQGSPQMIQPVLRPQQNAPHFNMRLADDRSELNDLLNSSPETKFLGKPAPTPTPTPPQSPKYFPVSFFT